MFWFAIWNNALYNANESTKRHSMSIFRKIFKRKKKPSLPPLQYPDNNTIIIIKEDGSKIINPEYIKGLGVNFQGKNTKIELHEPFSFVNLSVLTQLDGKHYIRIGKGFSCSSTAIMLGSDDSEILIGENCLFSWGITLMTSDFHVIIDKTTKEYINMDGAIIIKDHVWVGMDVSILKNTVIPQDCVIGAGSIVGGKFEKPNTIIAGIPARVIREDIEWISENSVTYRRKHEQS